MTWHLSESIQHRVPSLKIMNESILDAVTPIMRRCGFCCQSNKYFDGFVDFPRTARIQVQLCAIAFKSQNKREKLHKITLVIKSTNNYWTLCLKIFLNFIIMILN